MLDVKANFKNKFNVNKSDDSSALLSCNICDKDKIQDQKHVIECEKIDNNKNININYFDLFNKNINIVKKTIDKYEKSWKEMCDLKEQLNAKKIS